MSEMISLLLSGIYKLHCLRFLPVSEVSLEGTYSVYKYRREQGPQEDMVPHSGEGI